MKNIKDKVVGKEIPPPKNEIQQSLRKLQKLCQATPSIQIQGTMAKTTQMVQ